MSVDTVRAYFQSIGAKPEILEFSQSSATVELAALAVGTLPARIAKTLSFYNADKTAGILVVTAGDVKIDNKKFKSFFGFKAKMLSCEDVEAFTGHSIGGVCPFANPAHTTVYLDSSLKRFDTVYPAAGSASSAIEVTCEELERLSFAKEWIDVCKPV